MKKGRNMINTAVILPAYNEEKKLPGILQHLKKTFKTIVVVDDGSTDRTKAVAEAESVVVLSRGYNLGVGASTRDGLRWALENGFDAARLIDADGQHDPSEAQRFIERYEAKREPLIIGARDYKKIPLRRRIPNTFSRVVLSAIAGEYLEDNQCGYRLLDRRMIEAFLETNEAGYNFAIEMIIVCRERGWEIGWVPISTIYHDEKSKQTAWYQITGFTKMSILAFRRLRLSK